jgi:outer membrane lipoprotein carrier protein
MLCSYVPASPAVVLTMIRPLLVVLAIVGLIQPLVDAQPRSAESVARGLQERYRGINDFSAGFTQTYRGGFLRTQSLESGTLMVKRPGRMRWDYEKPERKQVIATGDTVYINQPSVRQVQVLSQDQSSTPALFLAGEGDIVRDFAVEFTDSPLADTIALKLTPRMPDPQYEHVVVAVDPSSLQIRALVTTDTQGGESTVVFTNLRENRGLADREFEFTPPRGFDVIRDGQFD